MYSRFKFLLTLRGNYVRNGCDAINLILMFLLTIKSKYKIWWHYWISWNVDGVKLSL